jgi:hypothetical protein
MAFSASSVGAGAVCIYVNSINLSGIDKRGREVGQEL